MKSCPACNRTFEDTFTFCLVDGAILSAPFDPHATRRNPTLRDTAQPPTDVLPRYDAQNRNNLPPTIASPQPAYKPPPGGNAPQYFGQPQFVQNPYGASSTLTPGKILLRTFGIVLAVLSILIMLFGGRDRMSAGWGLILAVILLGIAQFTGRKKA
jgi:hypothetical protein